MSDKKYCHGISRFPYLQHKQTKRYLNHLTEVITIKIMAEVINQMLIYPGLYK